MFEVIKFILNSDEDNLRKKLFKGWDKKLTHCLTFNNAFYSNW